MTAASLPELTGNQRARWSVVPTGDYTVALAVLRLTKAMGVTLYPYQVVRIMTLFARRPFTDARTADAMRWAAFILLDLIARQNGKNEWVAPAQIGKLFICKVPMQRHTAHNLETAEDAFMRAKALIEDCDMLMEREPQFRQANGKASIVVDGCRIDYRTRQSPNSARGLTKCGVLWVDEAFHIKPTFLGSALPTLSANPDSQLVFTSSPVLEGMEGMDHGLVLARVRKRAMEVWEAVENGDPDAAVIARIAAWEHAADEIAIRENRALADDPAVWEGANPGWAHLDQDVIREERTTMSFEQFLCERLGIGVYPDPELANGHVIQRHVLEQTKDEASEIEGPLVLYAAASVDRRWSSVAVAGWRKDRRAHVEVIERREGTAWVAAYAVSIVEKWDVVDDVLWMDDKDAITSRETDIVAEAVGRNVDLTIKKTDAGDAADAYGKLFDALTGHVPEVEDLRDDLEKLIDGEDEPADDPQPIRHLGQFEFYDAVAAASTRKLGDGTAWDSRASGDDISALKAVTGAYGVLRRMPPRGFLEDHDLLVLDD